MMAEEDNAIGEAVEELLVDPDAPDKGHATPTPQTIDAEPMDKE